jgi:hypothetical protein
MSPPASFPWKAMAVWTTRNISAQEYHS